MNRIVFLFVCVVACTDSERGRKTLENAGYTNIEMTGYEPFKCAESDDTCTGFRALGPSGRPVKGAVGCGFGCGGKGCTIRFD